jgi:hypothetical protein
MDLGEIGCEDVAFIQVAQNTVLWQVLVNMIF